MLFTINFKRIVLPDPTESEQNQKQKAHASIGLSIGFIGNLQRISSSRQKRDSTDQGFPLPRHHSTLFKSLLGD